MKRALLCLVVLLAAPSAARADHIESHLGPSEPTREFPAGFNAPIDRQNPTTLSEWSDSRVGGWGAGPEGSVARRPVVFVHGTTESADFWRVADCCNGMTVHVRDRFLANGYAPNELWAISYTGGRGYFTYNDINAEEVYEFLAEVRRFTGAEKIDVVAHSLGVTVVRKAAFNHPDLYDWVANMVLIAGANHGTTACHGVGTARGSHVCEETEPGSEWLEELNSIGETPAGPRYLVLYDSVGDNFYQGPDAHSPVLDGACNIDLPLAFHLPIARGEQAVATYLPFLRDGTDPCAG
jgi:pimeloyl-ACP methyl ester carboxylesterase